MLKHDDALHFKASTQCALCRKSLPDPNYREHFVPPQGTAWEYKVVGVCDIADSNAESRVVTIPADLTDSYAFEELSVKFKSGHSLAIFFCLETSCTSVKDAHLVHQSCWKLVNRQHKECTAQLIYNFAQSTYPIFQIGLICEETVDRILSLPPKIIAQGVAQTGLSRLLTFVLQLPLEIQLAIFEHCTSSLLLSLSRATNISSAYFSEIKDNHDQRIVELISDTAVTSLYAESIFLLGQSYISLLRFNDPRGISVEGSKVKALKFVTSCYGLVALRILYTDDSISPWLGEPTSGWYGIAHGSDIRRLRITQDNLKILRITFVEENTKSGAFSRVLWDKDLHFTSTHSHHLLDTTSPSQIRHFEGWRMCSYLPLFDDKKRYISELTMYCSGHSITGIKAVHGLSSRFIGQDVVAPFRRPIHFCLQRDERITSVWLRILVHPGGPLGDPTILVTTNYDRTCVFGPSFHPQTIRDMEFAWTRLGNDTASNVTGIFHDVLSTRPMRVPCFENIGITQDIKSSHTSVTKGLPRIPMIGNIPPINVKLVIDLYSSSAKLHQVRRLRALKVGSRVMGLLIYHEGGSIDVLGRWDSLKHSSILELYDHSHGILTRIGFSFSGEGGDAHVDGIFVELDDKEPSEYRNIKQQLRVFTVSDLNPPTIMWWFGRSCDYIEQWNAVYQEVNVSPREYVTMNGST